MSLQLKNQFLIAMPGLLDPSFEGTVTLICSHDEEGAMGVTINRPTEFDFSRIIGELDLSAGTDSTAARPVLAGGPVSIDRGFVLHGSQHDFDSTLNVSDEMRISFSLDAVAALANWPDDEPALFGLGYAGWEAGQLEQEVLENAWLTAPASQELVFTTPFDQRLSKAADSIGVDLGRLASVSGHG